MTADLWPTEIRLSADRRVLNVAFEDGARYALPAEYLRVSSPSAEVQGHSPLERKVIGGKRAVAILAVEPVGTLREVLVGPAERSDGRTNLAGALRRAMASCGYQTLKELQKAELTITPVQP